MKTLQIHPASASSVGGNAINPRGINGTGWLTGMRKGLSALPRSDALRIERISPYEETAFHNFGELREAESCASTQHRFMFFVAHAETADIQPWDGTLRRMINSVSGVISGTPQPPHVCVAGLAKIFRLEK